MMSEEEQRDGKPFNEADELLLQSHLDEVPQSDDIKSYKFKKNKIQSEVSDIESQLNVNSETVRWERYFSKPDDEKSEKYVLNLEILIEDWIATLVDHTRFDNPSKKEAEQNGECKITIEALNRGTITFLLFFDAEELLRTKPNDEDVDFLIAFRTPNNGIERKSVFRWHDVSNTDFPDEVRRSLIENQVPPTIELYNSGSYTAKKVPDGPERALESIARDREFEIKTQPHLVENVQLAGTELDVSSVSIAVEIDSDTHLTICSCKESAAENTHVHLVSDGELVSPKNNSAADEMLGILSKKIKDYNDLNDDYENVSRMDRILQVVVLAMILPSLGVVVSWLLGQSINSVLVLLNFIAFLFLVLISLFIWSPLLQLRLFSWDNPRSPKGLYGKSKDWVQSG